ncbi:o-succinylbenzoate synthase [Serinibacter arcticus]|uniref:o-succinylbenzoate synthase n=1 Tax=Serinibacter arcticus TaxID=1655435 RepID=A0A2U1ZWG9_9MICO|nr:o-succinylbenzoate synthase [Serinibacter arcticus]PWD51283.1 o-succinylbenzoate synthase [Serinibacter arcticus]
MKIEAVHLRRITLPLVTPFRTSQHVETERTLVVVELVTDVGTGWAECSTDDEPVYWADYLEAEIDVLVRHFAPALLAGTGGPAAQAVTPASVAEILQRFKGHRTAKSALEAAVLDAWTRAAGTSLADHLGGVRATVPTGVSVAISDSIPELLDTVDGYLEAGYGRIKLKIEPGRDIAVARAVREHIGPDVLLQVDANAAYSLGDAAHLAKLDDLDLLLIEQPLAWDDLHQHAALARLIRTPICLDESITSARSAAAAISVGACRIINIKPARVGGYLEARRIHDVAQAHGVPVWCGGMLESGLGRAANLALASLPGFTLPGDISATSRYYAQDITEPFELDADGRMAVPTGPGVGVEPDGAVLDAVTTWRTTVT